MKVYQSKNVYDSAIQRLEYIFDNFEKVYFSLSGGKDSSVMVQLALRVAKEKKRLPLNVLFIDLEAQYNATISHMMELMNRDDVNPMWVCLPLNLRNSVSMYEPQWMCWDCYNIDKWVRPYPDTKGLITDVEHFPFFRVGMEFEEFIVLFAEWFAGNKKTACGVGIRSDESLNRFRTLVNKLKVTHEGHFWTTQIRENIFNFYPIYDWRTEDIWTCIGREKLQYNKIYDLMYQTGMSIHRMRICQPFGDDQKIGLNLYKELEPETWNKIVNRVSGSNYGNIYCGTELMGFRKLHLPEGHTWKSYTKLLLDTIPKFESKWYQAKFKVFFDWWELHGIPKDMIPDSNKDIKKDQLKILDKFKDSPLYKNKIYHTKGPSWERLARCILKNDRICKSLSFAQTKFEHEKWLKYKNIYGI